MKLHQIKNLNEAEKNEIQFQDTEPRKPLPELIFNKVERKIRDGAKDYEKEWDHPVDLVDWAFQELELQKPMASDERWSQYRELVQEAVKELHKARGDNPMWHINV
jgi:hypothetical protein